MLPAALLDATTPHLRPVRRKRLLGEYAGNAVPAGRCLLLWAAQALAAAPVVEEAVQGEILEAFGRYIEVAGRMLELRILKDDDDSKLPSYHLGIADGHYAMFTALPEAYNTDDGSWLPGLYDSEFTMTTYNLTSWFVANWIFAEVERGKRSGVAAGHNDTLTKLRRYRTRPLPGVRAAAPPDVPG